MPEWLEQVLIIVFAGGGGLSIGPVLSYLQTRKKDKPAADLDSRRFVHEQMEAAIEKWRMIASHAEAEVERLREALATAKAENEALRERIKGRS